MSVQPGPTDKRYAANGVTTIYAVPFLVIEAGDLKVYLNGVLLTSGYTHLGIGLPTSSITFAIPPTGDLYLLLDVPFQRLTDYQENGDFLSSTVNRDFDRIWQALKQLIRGSTRALTLGETDVDGAGAYRAKGNRISDLGDPVADDDAVNKSWMRTYLADVIGAIQGPINNALNIFYKGPDNQNYVVQDLASTTDQAKGASLVGFLQAGVGAVARTVGSKLRETVSILDFGGIADGSFDNVTAWQNASAAVGVNGVVLFPGSTGATYFFGSDPGLSAAIIKADPGVVFVGPNIPMYGASRVITPVTVNITGSQNYTYRMTPEHKKPWAEKSLFLTDSDIDRGVVKPIVATGTTKLKINFLSSDTFIDATADQTSVSDQVTWNSIPADGIARLSFTPIRPGDELSACFLEAGVYRRMAMIRTSAGYYAIYADGGGAQPHYAGRLTGGPSFDNVFDYLGRTTHANVAPENSLWSIKVFSYNTFAVLFNGVEVTGILTVAGYIIDAGFGVVAIGVAQTLHVNGFVRWQGKPAGGKRGIIALMIGDSMTADIHGGWPYALREALNGSFGGRIISVINQAVSGQASGDQLTILQANGLQNANLVFIAPGANDIQFNVPAATYISNISQMLDICAAGFATPVVLVPQTWYLQANAGGGGQATINNGGGRDHRARLMRLCADRGVKCVDMMQVSGPILSNWLSNPDIDPWVRDNIHLTTHAYRIWGFALARAGADALCPRYDQHMDPTAFVISSASNGWNFAVQQPYFEVCESRWLGLSGVLSNGTITSGTLMYKLPAAFAPSSPRRFECPTNLIAPCKVSIDATGAMVITDAGAGTTWVDLSSITYRL